MIFKTCQAVYDTINAGEDVRRVRSENRSQVDRSANGTPPLTEEEAGAAGVKVNFNALEQAELHCQARHQYLSGFYHTQRFFSVQFTDDCDVPKNKKAPWESFITRKINRTMRKSREYFNLHDNRFTSVVSHGIGPCAWFDKTKWLPTYIPISSLYVATDTKIDFTNLEWFGIRWPYAEGELANRVFGPNSVRGWKKEAICAILKEYHTENTADTSDYDWESNPEKMWELVKQNMGYYCSDAVPTIPIIHFYFKDKAGWKMRALPDVQVKGDYDREFLYDTSTDEKGQPIKGVEEPVEASELDRILHCQFGDLSNTAPALYHSVRSLGFLLLEPCYWSNLMLCRLIQHTFEQFNVWLRATDAGGKGRAQMVNLFDKAFIPDGISIVPKEQRHQIDAELVEMVMARMKQLMGEKSAQYTQQADTGTQKEQTAFETMTKMQQVAAMMAALLIRALIYEGFLYEEICRRFCLSDSKDDDVLDFQRQCREFGIPRRFLNVELWDIQPETPAGQGNPTMAMATLQMLMQSRGQFPPEAQQEILQRWASLLTDPRTAERWVPLGKQSITDGQRDAEHAVGDMMAMGVPVQASPQFSPIEVVETMLTLLGEMISAAAKSGRLPEQRDIDGWNTILAFVTQQVKQLAQRPDEKEKVAEFGKVMAKLKNAIKQFQNKVAQQKAKQNGNGHVDPAAIAKAQAIKQQSDLKLQTAAAKTKQQLQHKNVSFAMDQKRKNIQTVADEQRKTAQAVGEARRNRLKSMEE